MASTDKVSYEEAEAIVNLALLGEPVSQEKINNALENHPEIGRELEEDLINSYPPEWAMDFLDQLVSLEEEAAEKKAAKEELVETTLLCQQEKRKELLKESIKKERLTIRKELISKLRKTLVKTLKETLGDFSERDKILADNCYDEAFLQEQRRLSLDRQSRIKTTLDHLDLLFKKYIAFQDKLERDPICEAYVALNQVLVYSLRGEVVLHSFLQERPARNLLPTLLKDIDKCIVRQKMLGEPGTNFIGELKTYHCTECGNVLSMNRMFLEKYLKSLPVECLILCRSCNEQYQKGNRRHNFISQKKGINLSRCKPSVGNRLTHELTNKVILQIEGLDEATENSFFCYIIISADNLPSSLTNCIQNDFDDVTHQNIT